MTFFFYQRRVCAKALVVFDAPFIFLCETLAPPPLFFAEFGKEREKVCVRASTWEGGRETEMERERRRERERERMKQTERESERARQTDRARKREEEREKKQKREFEIMREKQSHRSAGEVGGWGRVPFSRI